VSDRAIQYLPAFKIRAVTENQAGKSAIHIYIENGFDIEMIGKDCVKSVLTSWRKTFQLCRKRFF